MSEVATEMENLDMDDELEERRRSHSPEWQGNGGKGFGDIDGVIILI